MYQANGRGELVRIEVEAHPYIARRLQIEGLPAVREALGLPIELFVLREDHAALGAGRVVLPAHRREGTYCADGPRLASFVFGAVGLGHVLNHRNVVGVRQFQHRVHIDQLARDVGNNDGPGVLRDLRRDLLGAGIERVGY